MKKSMIVLLVAMFVLSVGCIAFAANPFIDVPANHWSYAAINKLAADGIIDGGNDGKFYGDKTITRYEMAIIVAKAMAKEDKATGEEKVLIEKLATEFKTELDSLGVRVKALEENANRIQLFGYIGVRNETTGVPALGATSTQIPSLRSTHFDVFTTFHATDKVNVDLETVVDKRYEIPYENFQAARMLWITNNLSKTTNIKIGRFDNTPVYGVVYNERIQGFQFNTGSTLKTSLTYGRNVSYSASVYSQNDDVYQDWLPAYLTVYRSAEFSYAVSNTLNIKTAYTDWAYNNGKYVEVGFDKKVGKDWLLKSEVAQSNQGIYKRGYYTELRYKNANPFVPGSYTIYTAYRNIPKDSTIDPINRYDLDFSYDFRGMTVGSEFTVAPKQALSAFYMWGKKPSDCSSTHVFRVQYSVIL